APRNYDNEKTTDEKTIDEDKAMVKGSLSDFIAAIFVAVMVLGVIVIAVWDLKSLNRMYNTFHSSSPASKPNQEDVIASEV
ncbi:hypothetical protein BgiBS90_018293, partial [Biomphalaria glabrata]